MKTDRLDAFVDPKLGRPLRVVDADVHDGQVERGRLVDLSGTVSYPIVDFIPRFVPRENYAGSFGLQWQIHRRTQLDSYNGGTYSRDRLFSATGWPDNLHGQRILEGGSGAGRFTEVLLQTGADVCSFDFSEAVLANYKNNGHHPNLTLFQGDIYQIPFPAGWFDKVICLGVIQHTPDTERTFQCLARMVRPGGMFVIDAYSTSWEQRLHWKYALRPVTKRVSPQNLYRAVSWYAPKLMPIAAFMRRVGGRAGARLIPILDQSDKAVPPDIKRDWTVLDTFDALSPSYDNPVSPDVLRQWFAKYGFERVCVGRGAIGIEGRGIAKPDRQLL